MIVDIKEKVESGWFELKGGGRLQLRLLSGKDIKEMRIACLRQEPEYPYLYDVVDGEVQKTGKYVRFEGTKLDNDLWDRMQWDRNIVSWEGLFDKNEKPIPVTTDMKVLLMTVAPEFVEAYDEGLKALKEAEAKKQEDEAKNSLAG